MADNSTPAVEVSVADKAKSIIEDAFRRADKNDDGCLSLEEFQTYFSDGTMSKSQLKELFTTIDTHNTNNIDISELCDYFSKYWGPFETLFANLDDLSKAVTDCVHKTAQHYHQKSFYEQFATRYLMKEALSHVCAIEKPLDNVTTSLEETALQNISEEPVDLTDSTHPVPQKTALPRWQLKLEKRISEQASRQYSSNPSCETTLGQEVTRLAELVTKLESKVNLSVIEEEVASPEDKMVFLVSYDIVIPPGDSQPSLISTIEQYIKQYIQIARSQDGCQHIMIRRYITEGRFGVYEVWEDEDMFNSHEKSVARETFKNGCSQYVKKTDQFEMPSSWWN